MKNLLIVALFVMSVIVPAAGQVGIGTTAPNSSSMLDVTSPGNNKGFLLPRMTQSQRNAIPSPANGLMIYQTDGTPGFYYYNGSAWTAVSGSGGGGTGHYIGEFYQGGIIFWVDNTGQHGLICSLVDLSVNEVWRESSNAVGSNAQSYWNGQLNSSTIFAALGNNENSAAKLCEIYTNDPYGTGEYTDWYLPALDQMIQLFGVSYIIDKAIQTAGIPNTSSFAKVQYWTSTEDPFWPTDAYMINLGTMYLESIDKTGYDQIHVRAIRSF